MVENISGLGLGVLAFTETAGSEGMWLLKGWPIQKLQKDTLPQANVEAERRPI